MELIKFPIKKKAIILALGAESAGVFAVYKKGDIFVSEIFGDLLEENNFLKYKKAVLDYLQKEKIKPNVVLTDLHPLFKTTIFGEELAIRLGSGQAKKKHATLDRKIVKLIKIQHHIAHIFSAVGDKIINAKRQTPNAKILNFNFNNSAFSVQNSEFYGLAMDGTGYGWDGNIWGGEVFRIQIPKPNFQIPNKFQSPISKIKTIRIGSLDEQAMIGGDAAVKEPARMIVAILAKLKIKNEKIKTTNKNLKTIRTKSDIYDVVKKYYSKNEFELLYSQLEQNFNCQITTSTGRVLDAVSVLLGFVGNERRYKHEAVKKLEENSGKPYDDLESRITNQESRKILDTTNLFNYLIKNINKDKNRLAATAQVYISRGLYEIIKKNHKSLIINHKSCIFAAGGMTKNRIIFEYLEKQGVYLSKKIPRGDEGITVGQIVYYLLN